MKQSTKKPKVTPGQSVFRWFLICFLTVSIIFCLTLIPLIKYCQNVFTDLMLEKSSQQLNYGIAQIENTVSSINGASSTLTNDPRFIPLRYVVADYSSIDISTRKQMKDYFHGLIFPLSLVSDCALLISEEAIVTPTYSYFNSIYQYYPDNFCVDELTYEEWVDVLSNNKANFLPVCQVKTRNNEYDALIYSIPWTKSAYIYVCIDITNLKKALIAESDLSDCYLSVSNTTGKLLYSDLPNTQTNCYTITKTTSIGGLSITVYIPKSIFTERMDPLYFFLGIYCSLCVITLFLTIWIVSRLSSKPLLKIIHMLEHSSRFHENEYTPPGDDTPTHSIQYGFHYIQHKLKQAENNLEHYQNALDTQKKILRTRFLEKALNGQMPTAKDKELFHSYFPDFPDHYCLVYLQLIEHVESKGNIYPDSLFLLQTFLNSELPNAIQQQQSDMELLLVIAENDYEKYCKVLNFMIHNINHEEPSYQVRCVAGKIYQHLESLPTAYRQLLDLNSLDFPNSQSQVGTLTDYIAMPEPINMADIFTLYTAITYGNLDLAIQKLHTYSRDSSERNRQVYELIHSVLECIKRNYPLQLMNVHVPPYSPEREIWSTLENAVITFCEVIKSEKDSDSDSFVMQLQTYIDAHYTEYELCVATLETVFHCSSSKIRKNFKNSMGVTVNDYIEKKRMDLANELLLKKEMTMDEIASKCGFSNANSFYKAYRRVYGHSPTIPKNG